MKTNHPLAWLGLLLSFPAGMLVTGGVLEFHVPGPLVHPVLIMGGLFAALLLNLRAIVQVQLERNGEGNLAAVNLRIGTRVFNLLVLAVSTLLLAAIVLYLVLENFQPRVMQ